ncbi:MAG: hypothetical protein WCT37_02250 [Patescibacteria group bacterium]
MRGSVMAVKRLMEEKLRVWYRDHHDLPEEDTRFASAREIRGYTREICGLLGNRARIMTRRDHPSCVGLVKEGEFADPKYLIIANPDADGLLTAMKAIGLTYNGMKADADVLDGPASLATQDRLTEYGWLLKTNLALLGGFMGKGIAHLNARKNEIFENFLKMVQGDQAAHDQLADNTEKKFGVFAQRMKNLAMQAQMIANGVYALDITDAQRQEPVDIGTLTTYMESLPGCQITVVVRSNGPLAKHAGGVQYSLTVASGFQPGFAPSKEDEIDLRRAVPENWNVSPESGVISHNAFFLHCAAQQWEDVIGPALLRRFGPVDDVITDKAGNGE